MDKQLSKTFKAITVLLVLSYFLPCCWSQNFSLTYQLSDVPGGSEYYQLNVSVSQSLYDYYVSSTHTLFSIRDFPTFVTPYVMMPVADKLWEIYSVEEDFANGVLMIVHQIPYVETLPVKYPVETIVANEGDCDLFSCLAASILKAAGFNVVLLYYEDEAHMNVGVHLQQRPQLSREQAYYVTHNNVRYYVAECTGDDWRVGECPDLLKQSSPQVITLENSNSQEPGQVSASYESLESSALSLLVSPSLTIQGNTVTISGTLNPPLNNRNVTIFLKSNNSPWTILTVVMTESNGRFTYLWKADVAGVNHFRAGWSGDNDHVGADSQVQILFTFSFFFILLLAVVAVLICLGLIMLFMSQQSQPEIPQPPEIPY